ncbi:DMT family transporter [Leptolyngbya sp. FACHB-711]|uniref:DMT family transporter n=1 Tax=unclassified Leptolyngbya TaxID=2650499 RepID=UPI0016881AC7|nr:DMT family transporter [Leptolyngbya sp. FACHB-711]MBD1848509.1 DMT family transporter [Cyanobacteria bacterium FACHB-502]MBD2025500.1 DMT family transporter [Leptolyngbya sp. FACHB-711]
MSFLPLLRSRSLWFRCQICLYLLLSLLSGVLLPIQASMNAQLARSLTSAPLAASVSYLVGFLALAILLLTQRFDHPDWFALPKAPHWSLAGGVFGAWYIASSAYFISTLGTTLTLGFVVFGQAIAGIIADHSGWLGLPRHRLTRYRRVAVGLLMVAIFFLAQ